MRRSLLDTLSDKIYNAAFISSNRSSSRYDTTLRSALTLPFSLSPRPHCLSSSSPSLLYHHYYSRNKQTEDAKQAAEMVWKKDRYIVTKRFVSSPIKILCSPKSGCESARVYHKTQFLRGSNQIHYCSNEGGVENETHHRQQNTYLHCHHLHPCSA